MNEINIDTQPIARAAVDEAVRQTFVAPKYRGEAYGPDFEEVKAQVRRHIAALDLGDVIAALDLGDVIAESIARQLPGVVDDVVGEMLVAAVKKRAKANNAMFEVRA